jgi:adenylate cyclase
MAMTAAPDQPPGRADAASESVPDVTHRHHHHLAFPVKLRLWDELKRRNLVRVAILYGIACYLILEPFELFFHLLELPAWSGRIIVVTMVMGFPIVMIFSWIYEVTPEGIKPTVEVPRDQSITRQTAQRLNRAIIAALGLAVVLLTVNTIWPFKNMVTNPGEPATVAEIAPAISDGAAPIEQSIAVLAFTNLSSDKEQEFFSDGLAEELLDLLARIPGMRVVARTSSFYFKGKPATVEEIGKALHVANVLQGSVRRSGNRLRVTTQLIRARDSEQLWSQSYERTLDDVFKVQDEIAGSVAAALKVKLDPGFRPAAYRPKSAEAHLQYLLGHQYFNQNTDASYRRAIDSYKKAIAIDPKYVAAYAGLALAEDYLADNTGDASVMNSAIAHAERAIALGPDEAGGYVARGAFEYIYQWKWKEALDDVERAIALDPESGDAYRYKANIWGARGKIPEATDAAKMACELDPLNPNSWVDFGIYLTLAGHFDRARMAFERGVALDRNNPLVSYNFAILALLEKKGEEANGHCAAIPETDSFFWACKGLAMHSLGRDRESIEALERLKQAHAGDSAYQIADAYAWRGDQDRAFEWLSRAIHQRDGGVTQIKYDPLLQRLHGDTRFKELLREVNLQD